MQYANYIGYSDVYPYEVIRFVSNKTLEVRSMDTEQDPNWKPEFVAGGFAGHCVNQHDQKWIITSNEANDTIRIRLRKDGTWRSKDGAKFRLSDKPRCFYDYNF